MPNGNGPKMHSQAMDAIIDVNRISKSLYDLQLPLSLACDASFVSVGIVIFHTLPNGTETGLCFPHVESSREEVCTNSKRGFIHCLRCTNISPVFAEIQIGDHCLKLSSVATHVWHRSFSTVGLWPGQ